MKSHTPEMAADERVISLCPMQGQGAYTMIALTNLGRMFERSLDPRVINQGPYPQPAYLWRPVKGPLDE